MGTGLGLCPHRRPCRGEAAARDRRSAADRPPRWTRQARAFDVVCAGIGATLRARTVDVSRGGLLAETVDVLTRRPSTKAT